MAKYTFTKFWFEQLDKCDFKQFLSELKATDLAGILGARSQFDTSLKTLENQKCDIWLLESYIDSVYSADGQIRELNSTARNVGVCPALSSDIVNKIKKKGLHTKKETEDITSQTIFFGEYPQTLANQQTSKFLEKAYQQKRLMPTGKQYTFNTIGKVHDERDNLWPYASGQDRVSLASYSDVKKEELCCNPVVYAVQSHDEFEFLGEKYVRLMPRVFDETFILSNKQDLKLNSFHTQHYWVKVEPIEWLEDTKGNWLSKRVLLGGIPVRHELYRWDAPYTFVGRFLKKHFMQDIMPTHNKTVKEKSLEEYKSYLCLFLNETERTPFAFGKTISAFSKQYILSKTSDEMTDIDKEILTYSKNLIKILLSGEKTPHQVLFSLQLPPKKMAQSCLGQFCRGVGYVLGIGRQRL